MEQSKGSKLVAIMSIDIGDGRIGKIAVRQDDDVEKLAIDFCEIYQLPKDKVSHRLAEHIHKTLSEKFVVRNLYECHEEQHNLAERSIQTPSKGIISMPGSEHDSDLTESATDERESTLRAHCDRDVMHEDGSYYHFGNPTTRQRDSLSVLKDIELMNQSAYKKEIRSIENKGKIGYSVLSPTEYLRVGNRLYDSGMKLIEKKRELCESARNRWLQSRQSRKCSGPESSEFQHLYTPRPRSAPKERVSRSEGDEGLKANATRSSSSQGEKLSHDSSESSCMTMNQARHAIEQDLHLENDPGPQQMWLYQEVKRRMTSLEESIHLKQKQQLEKEKEWKQKSVKCKSFHGNSTNSNPSYLDGNSVFNRLYDEAEILRKKRETETCRHDEIELKKVFERESQFVKGLQLDPFQPDIGRKARQLKRDKWDRRLELLIKTKKVEEEQNQIKQLTQELKDCTFKPKITESKRSTKTREGNIHEHLYEEAFNKKPNHSLDWQFESGLKTPTKKLSREKEQAMIARLQSPYQLDFTKLSRDESSTCDKTRIRDERSQERKISLSEAQRIGEKHHSVYKESERRKAYMMAERDRQMDETRNAAKSCRGSKRIVESAKEQHLRYIFAALDRDGDGLVTLPTLPVQARSQAKLLGDEETAAIIMPVLLKCAEFSDRPISFEQFKNACFAEFKTPLSNGFSPWHVIFGITSLKKSNGKPGLVFETAGDDSCSEITENQSAFSDAMSLNTFIDERVSVTSHDQNESPERMVKELKEGPNDFYEKSIQRQRIRDAVLAELREMKEREDLKECTFKPNIRSG
eukprot:746841-Hanusia_phi.AAC.5